MNIEKIQQTEKVDLWWEVDTKIDTCIDAILHSKKKSLEIKDTSDCWIEGQSNQCHYDARTNTSYLFTYNEWWIADVADQKIKENGVKFRKVSWRVTEWNFHPNWIIYDPHKRMKSDRGNADFYCNVRHNGESWDKAEYNVSYWNNGTWGYERPENALQKVSDMMDAIKSIV